MSTDSLIRQLSTDLLPIRRRNIARETFWLASLGTLELALFLGLGLMRSDMAQALGHPFMWWKLGSLAALVVISVTTALRSFSPTASPRKGLLLIGSVIGLIALAGALVDPSQADSASVLTRLEPLHGLACATCIVVLSLPMVIMLSIFMRKGASTHPEATAAVVGLAGGSWGALVFAFCCPMNDPLYVFVWYALACSTLALVARMLLPRLTTL